MVSQSKGTMCPGWGATPDSRDLKQVVTLHLQSESREQAEVHPAAHSPGHSQGNASLQ